MREREGSENESEDRGNFVNLDGNASKDDLLDFDINRKSDVDWLEGPKHPEKSPVTKGILPD